VGLQTSQVIG